MIEEKKKFDKEPKGSMTVQEAGRRGGQKTAEVHDKKFYKGIGEKGGDNMTLIIAAGHEARGEFEKAKKLRERVKRRQEERTRQSQ